MYADHLLPLVAEMLPQPGPKDNKPDGRCSGPKGVTRPLVGDSEGMAEDEEPEVPERVARGLVTGWLLAKTMPLIIKVATWLTILLVALAGGALAWWRARRAVLKGALDHERESALEPLPSEVVRERGLLAWIKGEA